MKYVLLKVGVVAICFTVASFGTTVTYTENASVAGGCTDPVSGLAIVLTHGTCNTANLATSIVQTAYAVSTFTTGGAEMNGLQVTAFFSDSTSQTLTWATTNAGTDAGGVSQTTGTDKWSLTLTGDSFTNNFILTNSATTSSITSIVLQGIDHGHGNCPTLPASILCGSLFDRISPGGDNDANEQTPNSHRGIDFAVASQGKAGANYTINATYSNEFKSGATNACVTGGSTVTERSGANGAPCGDEWAKLTIVFNATGTNFAPGATLNFVQDVDSTISSPEPSSLLLCGLGLWAALGCIVKRNRLKRVLALSRTTV